MNGTGRIIIIGVALGLVWTLALMSSFAGEFPVGIWLAGILGAILGTRGFASSLHRRETLAKDLEESLASTELLLDSLPVGVVLIGHDRIVRRINKTALTLLGKDEEGVLGKTCHESICPARADCCPILDEHQEVDNSERVLNTGDGSHLPVLTSVVPVVYRGDQVLLEAFVDISERKESISKLQSSLDEIRKFNDLAVGRELRMMELKQEVNELLAELKRPARYVVQENVRPGGVC